MADNRNRKHTTEELGRTAPAAGERKAGRTDDNVTPTSHQLNANEEQDRSRTGSKNRKKYSRDNWEFPLL